MPIRIILRPDADTDTEALIGMIDGMAEALRQTRALQSIPTAISIQETLGIAQRLPGSLTFSPLAPVISERRANLRLVAFNGVMPSLENLANGTYPKSLPLYLVIRADATQAARDFVAFVQSPAGSALLLANGILPESP
jgi:phosphate transport system substrate-binding protein